MREYSDWLQVINCTDLRIWKRKTVLRFRAGGNEATPKGLALENGTEGWYNWEPTAGEGESVLEFVAFSR